jgi:hypothetical protein
VGVNPLRPPHHPPTAAGRNLGHWPGLLVGGGLPRPAAGESVPGQAGFLRLQ